MKTGRTSSGAVKSIVCPPLITLPVQEYFLQTYKPRNHSSMHFGFANSNTSSVIIELHIRMVRK
jgi:hypothetical protein